MDLTTASLGKRLRPEPTPGPVDIEGRRRSKMRACKLKRTPSEPAAAGAGVGEKKVEASSSLSRKSIDYYRSDDFFNERLDMLRAYKKEFGHCYVPKYYPPNSPLSSWVYRVRALYRDKTKGKENILTDERVRKLEEVGFAFSARNSEAQLQLDKERRKSKNDSKWNDVVSRLEAFKLQHGNCLVPKIYSEDQRLSAWVFRQREQKRQFDKGELTPLTRERLDKLDAMGFVWHSKKDDGWQRQDRIQKQARGEAKWQHNFQELKTFIKQNGHSRVPKVYPKNQCLSSWVFRQRSAYKRLMEGDKYSMPEARLEQLKSVDFEFSIRKKSPASSKAS